MVYLEITKKKWQNIERLNTYLSNKDAKVFILIYMEGCQPCNETRPEWSKLKNVLSTNFLNRGDIVIASIDKDLFGKIKNANKEPMSFPTIRFMINSGKEIETYEDSKTSNKDRKIDSFIEWIKLKTGENNITKSEEHPKLHKSNKTYRKKLHGRKTRKQFGGKWSTKYKRSINCNNPKGFSQRQYCKYRRNK